MDTTGHLITMVTYYLTQNPECLKKLLEEVNKFIKSDEDLNNDNFKEMHYLEGVIKETLRMYGPASGILPRVLQKDVKLGKYQFKKGTAITFRGFYNQYNEKYFPEPEKFKPERWENSNAPPFVFIPFSAGINLQ